MGRVKVGKLEVYPADPEIGVAAMIMRLPEGRRTQPDVITLQPKEIPWLIEQLQALVAEGPLDLCTSAGQGSIIEGVNLSARRP